MTTTLARRYAALLACAAFGFATSAYAQDKTVKIGVLNDMSSLYADIGGANSVAPGACAVRIGDARRNARKTGIAFIWRSLRGASRKVS